MNWAYLWQNNESGIIKMYPSVSELQAAQGISPYTLKDLVWMKLKSIQISDHVEVHKVPVSSMSF